VCDQEECIRLRPSACYCAQRPLRLALTKHPHTCASCQKRDTIQSGTARAAAIDENNNARLRCNQPTELHNSVSLRACSLSPIDVRSRSACHPESLATRAAANIRCQSTRTGAIHPYGWRLGVIDIILVASGPASAVPTFWQGLQYGPGNSCASFPKAVQQAARVLRGAYTSRCPALST